ncbi:MAG: MFS transporter [Pseudomonadota bacterium]|nr:MFS transporter [Pseudomonadota bacterium]
MHGPTQQGGTTGRLPAQIWALGLVSLFMDIASETVHALLPVFLVTSLGASVAMVGLIEGVGESTAAFAKVGSGWLSDRLRRRKGLVVLGYTLGALSKPAFAVAPAAGWVMGARFVDRLGKGIRGAPRDALIGDLAPAPLRGAAFGLRQSLDTAGAFLGPLAAIALMALTGGQFRLVFWLAVIPGLVAVAILVLAVREPPRPAGVNAPSIRWHELPALGRRYWGVVAVAGVLTLARFSVAFLILRAEGAGLSLALTPAVLVVMNLAYSASAWPMGALSDRMPRRHLLTAGFAVLMLAQLVLAFAPGLPAVMAAIALWGLHMGMTQGLLAALVTDTAPARARGSAFGLFHLVSGLALLAANFVAGGLWSLLGPASTFLAGAAFAGVGLAGLALYAWRR